MSERGALLVAGPFDDQPDETLRGLCIYRTPLEETRALVDADPSIQAGRMQADVFTWYTQRGAVEFRSPLLRAADALVAPARGDASLNSHREYHRPHTSHDDA